MMTPIPALVVTRQSHVPPQDASAILVVDDQSTSRAAITKIVQSVDANINVYSFGDPKEALEWTKSNEPALILTDYKMPAIDGIELTRRFRKMPSTQHVPIIVVTVVEEREVRQNALEAGATDFLTKPVDPDECRLRCRNLLLISRQQRSLREHCRSLEATLTETTELLEKLAAKPAAGANPSCITLEYEKLYELTSSVSAAASMLTSIRASIEEWEELLRKPLHGRPGEGRD